MGKGYKGRNPRGGPKPKDPDYPSEEEDGPKYVPPSRGLGQQAATVGMMPPSDSEDEEGSKGEAPKVSGSKAKEAPKKEEKKAGGQSKTAGLMPPSDSEDDDDDDEDDSTASSDHEPEYLKAAPKKDRHAPEPRDPEEIRKEMERLQLIRKKREEDRQKRIAAEGWDRFAPVSETNKPPGSVAPDHPSNAKA